MDYAKAVAEARRLVKSVEAGQWRLAELTYLILVEDGVRMEVWAADVGLSKTYGYQLKAVWAKYGDQPHTRTFNEYLTLAGVSRRRARQLEREAEASGGNIGTIHRNSRDQSEREVARRWLRNPQRLHEMLEDRKIRGNLEREFRRARAEPPTRRRPRSGHARRLTDLTDQLNLLISDLLDITLYPNVRRNLLDALESHETSVDWLGDLLRSDDRSFEDVLDRLLEDAGTLPEPEPAPQPAAGRKPRRIEPAPVPVEPVAEEPAPTSRRGRRPRQERTTGGRHRVAG